MRDQSVRDGHGRFVSIYDGAVKNRTLGARLEVLLRKIIDSPVLAVNYLPMKAQQQSCLAAIDFGKVVEVTSYNPDPAVVVVCEHASNRVPAGLSNLGLSAPDLQSHIAWDPGAAQVASDLAQQLGAIEVAGKISRLVYDCNRPPDSPTAVPVRSERTEIPGNTDLSVEDRLARVNHVYQPFNSALTDVIAEHRNTLELMVTVHSFTPVFHGSVRSVEIGVLHGKDDRFAKAMIAAPPQSSRFEIRMNEPYSARDGVAHTLDQHGLRNGLLNVMIEVRNDLIQSPEDQTAMASFIASWVRRTIKSGFQIGETP